MQKVFLGGICARYFSSTLYKSDIFGKIKRKRQRKEGKNKQLKERDEYIKVRIAERNSKE